MNDWKPWDDYKLELAALPIAAPPCGDCKHWRPIREYSEGKYIGVKLCHAEDDKDSVGMCSDFSCYEPREN